MNVGILAHLLDARPGYRQAGVSRYIEHLVRELPSVSPDQFVLYGGRHSFNPSNSRRPHEQRSGLRASRSWLPTGRPESRIVWEQICAPMNLERDQIDVVHATVNVAPALTRLPTVVTIHDLAFLRYPDQYPKLKQRYLTVLSRRSVEHATRVIAVSENTRNDVLQYYRIDPERVVTVLNGVDPSMHPVIDDETVVSFRARHNLPDAFILFLGTLQPRKNLIALLRAWAKLDVAERLPLVVVGARGWMYEPIYDVSRSLGIAGDVIFKGFADPADLPLWYSAATIFVYPSLYEGFGMPVLESMACGTPVIASNTSSLPEVAGDAALLIDPHDVPGMSEGLSRLSADRALRDDLSRRGIQRAAQFRWSDTARQTADVYREAAANGATRKD